MISKETILSRFINKYGNPIQSSKAPFFVGSKKQSVGMTTDLQSCMVLMLRKFREVHNRLPKELVTTEPINLLKEQEIRYVNDDGVCIWLAGELIDMFHILDMRPFSKIEVKLFPDETMPIFASRDSITIMLAPSVLKNTEYQPSTPKKSVLPNPWVTGKLKFDRVMKMSNTTFWLEQYNGDQLPMYPTGYEMVKCENCLVEFEKQDYLQMVLKGHPQCQCSCNTYDDWCGCQTKRLQIQGEKQSRELKKRLWYMKRWEQS